MDDTLIKVESVSKKFCRSLKKSLWYGMQDLGREITGRQHGGDGELRPDEFWAVKDVSFELKRGECLGLIGHNGAGKSTLLKMLNGLIRPDSGRIEMRGRIAALIELGAGFNPIMTGRENIFNRGTVMGLSKNEISAKYESIVAFSELEEFMETPVQNYSSGMQARLGFSVSAFLEPDVLIIDEVLAVGDLGFRMKCYTQIGKILQNSTVVIVSHSMPQISWLCDKAMYMSRGHNKQYTIDVSKAIDFYYSEFGGIRKSQTGTGMVLVDNFSFVGKTTEHNVLVLSKGEKLKFQFIAKSLDKPRDISLKIEVWNQEVRPSAEVDFNHRPEFCSVPREGVLIQIDVPQISLSNGRYFITVNVLDPVTHEIFCRVGNAAEFLVVGSKSSPADYVVDGKLKLESFSIHSM